MPNYRRYHSRSNCHFFTLVSYQRKPFFIQPEFRTIFHNSIKQIQQKHPFEIDAMVLLPDHLHCILTFPDNDTDYSRRWSMIKRFVTQSFTNDENTVGCAMRNNSRIKRGESNIWQRRFWEHEIRDQQDHEKHLDYCYRNPVKHGLVQQVRDWPYSTFHRDVKNGLYPLNWCGDTSIFKDIDFGE